MAVRMGGKLSNIKVPEGEILVPKLKAVGVVTGVDDADGSDEVKIAADGAKTVAQLAQDHDVFNEILAAVPDGEVPGQGGLAHVPAAGTEVRLIVAFRVEAVEDAS